jgi:hypothetical protein
VRQRRSAEVIDEINRQFGKHKLALGPAWYRDKHRLTGRDELPQRPICFPVKPRASASRCRNGKSRCE